MLSAITGSAHALLCLIYPLHCAVCEAPIEQGILCLTCDDGLSEMPPGHCLQCGEWTGSSATLCFGCVEEEVFGGVCYGLYEENKPLAMLIQRLKYNGDRGLITLLGEKLIEVSGSLPRPDTVTFVPMQWRRQRQRGFNQAELLAGHVGGTLDIPVEPLLTKTKKTKPQAVLQRRQRLVNLEDAFEAKPNSFNTVWLIDDVRTTGATLRACAQALRYSGVHRVYTLTLAAALPPKGAAVAH